MTSVFVHPDFTTKVFGIVGGLQPKLTEAMDAVMVQIEDMARQQADWNPDGTVVQIGNREYTVTGAARESITAYAVGAARSPQKSFSMTDPLNKHVHDSVQITQEAEIPGVVQGVVTMAEDHSEYLQKYEMRGPSTASPALFGGGRTIVTEVLSANESWLMSALAAEALAIIKAL